MSVEKLTCAERDELLLDLYTGRLHESWKVASSLTDAYGEFGEPLITTTWERCDTQIEDVRHPKLGQYSPPDERPCEHYRLTGEDMK